MSTLSRGWSRNRVCPGSDCPLRLEHHLEREITVANHDFAIAATADEELVARRRLGKTNLSVKAAQIGTSNATKPENLGLFEYAHLRAPLPTDLKGSEIFPSHPSQHPETYFLMVRRNSPSVSADYR